MFPSPFQYSRPSLLAEALAVLQQFGDSARLLAGGHSLLPIVAAQIADPAARNRGTIGGALANGDPTADWPAAMIAMDAQLDIVGAAGARRIAAERFFTGLFATALQPGDILVAIRLPIRRNARVAYRKFRHPASGYAVVAVAVVLEFDAGRCRGGRLAVTGLTDRAMRLAGAESLLAGYSGQAATTDEILNKAFVSITPLVDGFADAPFRLQLARTMLKRALADTL